MLPLLLLVVLTSPPAPPASALPQTPPPATIPGDRLGWTQDTGGAAIAAFTWGVFIDNVRTPLPGASCTPRAQVTLFDCSVLMPPLLPGVRVLELIATRTEAGLGVDSPRSVPFPVSSLAPTLAPTGPRIIRVTP